MTLRGLIIALTLALSAWADGEVPRFNATLTVGQEHRFVLLSQAGKASPWLKLGESFDGFQIKAFDQAASTLELERAGEVVRVTLMADASVKDGSVATASDNRRVLESFVTKIPATGTLLIRGQRYVAIAKRSIAPGTKFAVRYQEKDYLLELVGVSERDFTVRFRGEEFTYPIRPQR